jgi:hypothetical protein
MFNFWHFKRTTRHKIEDSPKQYTIGIILNMLDKMGVDFTFIKDKTTRFYIQDAYNVISAVDGGWAFLTSFVPDEGNGFMFSQHPMLNEFAKLMHQGHSGASFAFTMRAMEMIAKQGFAEFRKIYE